MNKNKILALAVGFTFLASATPKVFAQSTTSSAAVSLDAVTSTPIISVDLSGDNKTNLLVDIGLTEEEFSALGLTKGKGGNRSEMTEEERTAKLEEKAAELGITVEELKAQMPEKGERPAKEEMTEDERKAKLEEKATELGITVEELKAQGPENGEKPARQEMTEEEKTAKLEEKAAELGVTVEELKAQMPEKGERPDFSTMTEEEKAQMEANRPNDKGRIIRLSQSDVDALENATGIEEDELLTLLKVYEATK